MTTAEKVAFARTAYELGKCPGCGAPLELVAGIGTKHYMGGQEIHAGHYDPRPVVRFLRNPNSGPRVVLTRAGDPAVGVLGDSRLCPWSADDLAALVHIGSGLVSA